METKVTPPPGSPLKEMLSLSARSNFDLREDYVKKYGFTLCTAELIETMANAMLGSKVVELGSGTGTLGGLLRQKGVDITLTDIGEEGMSKYGFDPIVKMDIYQKMEDIDLSPYDTILLTWPSYDDPCCEDVLRNMKPGSILFYCGEGWGGCTGTKKFHDILFNEGKEKDGVKLQFKCLTRLSESLNDHHVRWCSMYDRWSVYQKV